MKPKNLRKRKFAAIVRFINKILDYAEFDNDNDFFKYNY